MHKIAVVRRLDASRIEDDIYETAPFKQELLEFTTVGLAVLEDEEKLVLASTIGRDKDGTFNRDNLLFLKKIIAESILLPVTTGKDAPTTREESL